MSEFKLIMNIIKAVFLFYFLLRNIKAGYVIVPLELNPFNDNSDYDINKLKDISVAFLFGDQTDLPENLINNPNKDNDVPIHYNK